MPGEARSRNLKSRVKRALTARRRATSDAIATASPAPAGRCSCEATSTWRRRRRPCRGVRHRACGTSGYTGRIVSFEPVSRQFERLLAAAAGDDAWECQNRAGGASSGTATINISGNDGFSSSLLAMNQAHERAVGESRYEGEREIEVGELDEALRERLPRGPART